MNSLMCFAKQYSADLEPSVFLLHVVFSTQTIEIPRDTSFSLRLLRL